MDIKKIIITEEQQGQRVDVFLASCLRGEVSRCHIKKLILQGDITNNSKPLKPHYILKPGDVITIASTISEDDSIIAEKIPLDVMYEDKDLLVINKQAGLVVHPGAGNKSHTLVNALKFYLHDDLSQIGGDKRAGIIHRLDKDTSGVMVIAKNDWTHERLADQFKNRIVKKVYAVVVKGVVQHDEGICEEPIGRGRIQRKKMIIQVDDGKDALTQYRVIKRFSQATLLNVFLGTGRTHQIRVHMAFLGYPVLGDGVYGTLSSLIPRQALHARFLEFIHPRTKKRMSFDAPLPHDIMHALSCLDEYSEK
jgi:23S rRNA pseudouridine1911/1915/1917 synthase